MPLDREREEVVAAVVLTVSVEAPEPPGTELGLKEHVGPRVTAGAMLQVRFTALLKPFNGEIVIVEVAVVPAAPAAGESGDVVSEKSPGAFTVRLTEALWLIKPLVPVTVTLKVPTGVVT